MSYFNENNPFMKMFNQLSEETQKEYQQKGSDLYDFINFETGELCHDDETPRSHLDKESIERSLKSGLIVDDLTDEEKKILFRKEF